jgi:hypothetical protein
VAKKRYNSREPFGNCFTEEEIDTRNALMQKQEFNLLKQRHEQGPKKRIKLMLQKTPYEDLQTWQGMSSELKQLVKPKKSSSEVQLNTF